MSSTINVSRERLDFLRIVLVSRFRIVSALYPDRVLSQSELGEQSSSDTGNLSRYIREMVGMGVLVRSETKSGPRFRLGEDARHILSSNLEFLTDDGSDLRELDRDTWVKVKGLLGGWVTRSLAADELQRLSLSYSLGPDSGVLEELVGLVVEEEYRDVRNVLLLALSNFVSSLGDRNREWASGVLYNPLRSLLDRLDDSDRGRRSRRIVGEVFDLLGLFVVSFDGLVEECLVAVSEHRFDDCGLVVERLVGFYPDRVVEFRLCLVEHYGGVDVEGRMFIESLLGKLS